MNAAMIHGVQTVWQERCARLQSAMTIGRKWLATCMIPQCRARRWTGWGPRCKPVWSDTVFDCPAKYRALFHGIQQLRLDLCHRMPSAAGLLAESQWELSADNHLRVLGETHAVIFRSLCGRCRANYSRNRLSGDCGGGSA